MGFFRGGLVAIVAGVVAVATAAAAAAGQTTKLNVGGGALPGWSADDASLVSGATIAKTFNGPVTGSPAALYNSFRFVQASGAFTYTFPVTSAGTYTVSLHFAEVWSGAQDVGKRVFSVALEGAVVLEDYDIFADVGANVGTVKIFSVSVSDGALDITFTSVVQNAVVMAIEVESSATTPTPSPALTPTVTPSPTAAPGELVVPVKLNVGGSTLGEYTPDTPYVSNVGSTTTGTIVKSVGGTTNDELYHTFRYGKTVSYTLPVAPGTYTVSLLLAEVYTPVAAVGKRVFDIAMGDATGVSVVAANYDLFADAGEAVAVAKSYDVTVVTSPLVINLVASVQNVALQGIEVVLAGSTGPSPTPSPALTPTVTPSPTAAPGELVVPVKLNVGGSTLGEYTPDTPYVSNVGSTTTGTIVKSVGGTTNDELYHTFRYGKTVSYTLPVATGTYTVSLLLAEVYTPVAAVGKRVFDIAMGDATGVSVVAANYDLFADAGEAVAVAKSYDVTVVTSPLVINLVASVQNVALQGIEVVLAGSTGPSPTPSPALTPTVTPSPTAAPGELVVPVKLNVGGSTLGEYTPDTPYVSNVGSTTTGTIVKSVGGTTNDELYHTFRYGKTVSYTLPVATGTYTVSLLLAEVYTPVAAVGKRVFDIAMGDATGVSVVAANYDLFADAGEAVAVAKSYDVTVVTSPLVINLVASVQNVALQGIEVVLAGSTGPSPTPSPALTPTVTPSPTAAPGELVVPVKLNVGGSTLGEYTPDTPYVSNVGSTTTGTIVKSVGGTTNDELYHTFRYGKTVSYTLPVATGTYTVSLLLAEVYTPVAAVGKRVFDIAMGDATGVSVVAANYDLFADAGEAVAVAKSYDVTVVTSPLVINLVASVQNVALQGIEVVLAGSTGPSPTPSPALTPTVTPSPTAAPGELVVPVKLNVGGSTLGEYTPDTPYVSNVGSTTTGTIVKSVGGTTNDELYHTFRYGKTVSYTLPVATGTYTVSLLLAEVYTPVAAVGKRVFDIAMGDATGVSVVAANYDLFADAGEAVAVAKSYDVTVVTSPLVINLVASVQNVALQGIEVVLAGSTGPFPTPTSSSSPSPTPAGLPLLINAGGTAFGEYVADTSYVSGLTGSTTTGKIVVPIAGTDADALFHTFRYGKTVQYTLPLPAGVYDVSLLFAEVYAPTSAPGMRVFSIAVGDGAGVLPVLSDFDIFSSVGAATAVRKEFTVDVATGGLVVSMTALVENVAVQAIEVYASGTRPAPTPVPTPAQTPPPVGPADHFAHAVIDDIPTTIDADGDGVAAVSLTGFGSHTHRFVDGVAASLVRYTWVNNDTEVLLGQGLSILAMLPLGTTNVRFEVEDSGGDVSAAFAAVTVAGSLAPGAYCYYYKASDVPASAFPLPQAVGDGPKPVYAAVAADLTFSAAADFPSGPHGSGQFVQRCSFLYKAPAAGNYSFSASFAGSVAMTIGAETVFDEVSAAPSTAAGVVELAEGLHEGQLQYKLGTPAGVSLNVNGSAVPATALEWDSATVLPVIVSLSPAAGGISGGDQVVISGIGFYTSSTEVLFGTTPATAVTKTGSTVLTVTTPSSISEQSVTVTVATGGAVPNEGGVSNGLPFSYSGSCPPIKFVSKTLAAAGGAADQFIKAPTSIALGPDGRVYLGLYSSFVQAYTFDSDYVVTDVCTSQSLGASRSVLSLTFDPLAPGGNELVLYATTGILYHEQRVGLPLEDWDNGQVVVLTPNTNGFCLGVAATPITGLPVGNHDHAAQALEWTQDGKLLISVGGMTNLGANVNGVQLGGLDETPLSAAYLIADVRKTGFDGAVTYNGTTGERYVVQTGGFDVSVYATGVRNSYGSTLHTNGNLYATDNGPNKGFGDLPDGCFGSKPSLSAKDELLLITPGSYHGHPNRNRARNDPLQCDYYPPNAPASTGYTPTLANLEVSSMNGVIEYMANLWCGALKHDLLVSKFTGQLQAGETKRVQLGSGGTTVSSLTTLTQFSGLLMVPTASGAILAPQPQKNKLIIYEPVHPSPPAGAAPVVTAVVPHRGPLAGGNTVTIGGSGFGPSPSATLGGAACTGVKDVAPDGTSFRCTAPAGTPGGLVRVVVTRGGDGVSSNVTPGNGDYWYMTV
ncbi:hypothetical protein MMPV_008126 [Pyropia vietnamensis]